jgi:hypothetical protein
MPALMGSVIAATAGSSGSSQAGFYAGFALLIGTQVVVFGCGLAIALRERHAGVGVRGDAAIALSTATTAKP